MYPVQIDFKSKKCVVIGAGKTALRRIEMLRKEGAAISVVAPHNRPECLDDMSISYLKKEYDKSDIRDAFMVFAATDNEALNESIVRDARDDKILVTSVTKCTDMDVLIPAIYHGNNITLSVSTSGLSPALSAGLCRKAGEDIKKYDGLCEIHQKIRDELSHNGTPQSIRHDIMKKISSHAMCMLYSIGGKEPFMNMVKEICSGNLKKTENKKAILVVSFGTSYENTRNKTIGAVETKIRAKFSGFDVFRAFTSGMIIRKLRKDGVYVDTVAEALTKLALMGYTEVYCQPTHIMPGEEYDDLCRDAKMFEDSFSVLKIGSPLLACTDDYMQLIDALSDEIKQDSKTAVVFMGHGTTHWANCVYPALQFWLKKTNYTNVFVGTVEGFPTLDDVIEQLQKGSYDNVILMPLMLVAGDHAQNDMAGDDDDSWKSILSDMKYEVEAKLKGLGEYGRIQDMYVKHLSKIIN